VSNIYQAIWDADQASNGVRALFDNQPEPADLATTGFVKVNSDLTGNNPETKVLLEAKIPASKMRTYELCKKLFNNYTLPEPEREEETPEEREEIHNFVQTIVDTPPMMVAREFVAQAIDTTVSKERWYAIVLENWFRRFSSGGDPDLSGFEHVLAGEQEGAKVQGYHFWYKFLLDDGFAHEVDGQRGNFPGLPNDRIAYLGSFAKGDQLRFPESVTISYRWQAPDYDKKEVRPLTKPKGGFFVGCSAEGLMAMGCVRAHVVANAPKEAVINGARYDLKMFRSSDNKNIRTFYPVFLGPAADVPPPPPPPNGGGSGVVPGQVRIVGALLNPVGPDEGKEAVILINTKSTDVSLNGWRLIDKMNQHFEITDLMLPGSSAVTVRLPKNSAQLSNKGGTIRLANPQNQTVHSVSFTKQQAEREGETILF
jgi:poly(U)-specific endoribonuclease